MSKTIKEELLKKGIIEIRLFSDTNFIYLINPNKKGRDWDICLASIEFKDSSKINEAIKELYLIVKQKEETIKIEEIQWQE